MVGWYDLRYPQGEKARDDICDVGLLEGEKQEDLPKLRPAARHGSSPCLGGDGEEGIRPYPRPRRLSGGELVRVRVFYRSLSSYGNTMYINICSI